MVLDPIPYVVERSGSGGQAPEGATPITLYGITGGGGGGAVDSVNGQAGEVVLDASDVGLGNVDNTADANKPVSTAQAAAINAKVSTSGVASLDTVGWGRAVFIPSGGTVPVGTPDYTIVVELP